MSNEDSDEPGVAYDVALQNVRADIAVIKMQLMDNRPLAALRTAVETEERLEDMDLDGELPDDV